MVTPVQIPRLSIGMTEGTLATWLVEDGDRVAPGTAIFLLETEKVENEVEATVAGVLRVLADAGVAYAVGTTVAEIE